MAQVLAPVSTQAFGVANYTNPETLAQSLLVPGWSPLPGTVVVSEAAGTDSVGFFNNGSSVFGIDSGVIITNGLIQNAIGPNVQGGTTGDGIISSLSFDFIAVSPEISWRYVFASEEWNPFYYDPFFNDSFTLTIDNRNIATLPGTNLPIDTATINWQKNTSSLISNWLVPAHSRSPIGDVLSWGPYNTQYDAFTVPLTAKATGLIVGQTYTATFEVEDGAEDGVDSAVLISSASVSFPGSSTLNPLLPASAPSPGQPWQFPPIYNFDPDFVWQLDPDVAIGYIYNVTGGPLFDQYTAPDLLFNSSYTLYGATGGVCSNNPNDYNAFISVIPESVAYDFASPLACFAIKGIDPQNALALNNTAAFMAGVSFDSTLGLAYVTQLPIPVPGPLPLLGVGATYGWARRLRRRTRAGA